jgi:hypothetical protein
MSELEMKTEVETEDFSDELSDEALDRNEGRGCYSFQGCNCSPGVGCVGPCTVIPFPGSS